MSGARSVLLLKIPLLLTGLRALLAPVVVLLALYYPNPIAFAICLLLAFFSDVFDGIIARRLGIATSFLRRLDSIADSVFYLAAVFAAWHLYPDSIKENWLPLCLLALLELTRYAFDLIKFRREASYHMWSSKLWGLFLFFGFFSLLVLGESELMVKLAVYVGIFADLEGLAISIVLKEIRSDVPTVLHALRRK